MRDGFDGNGPDRRDTDDLDALLDQRLKKAEDRIKNRIGGGEREKRPESGDGRQTGLTAPVAPSLGAEVVTSQVPASLRVRHARSDGVIEFELQVSGAPMQPGPVRMAADGEKLRSLCLSAHLKDGARRDDVIAAVEAIQTAMVDTVPDALWKVLAGVPQGSPITLRVDASLLDVPWELMPFQKAKAYHLGDHFHIGRVAIVEDAVTRAQPRLTRDRLRMLVIGDPDQSLGAAGVDVTLDNLQAYADARFKDRLSYDIYRGPIEKPLALSLLGRGGYDIVFYMGHGCLSPVQGFALAGSGRDRILTPRELTEVLASTEPPRLWLADACLSARMPSERGELSPLAGTVAALASQGVVYVGTSWSIFSPAAVGFALGFIEAMLNGLPLGTCLPYARAFCYGQAGEREGIVEAEDPDPYSFVLYGDPSTRVVVG